MISAAKPQLILASSSPRRRDLLAQVGRPPDLIVPADADECERPRELPRDLALRLAIAKAETVAHAHPDAIVIGADTVVALGRRILPKAETARDVDECLVLLSGRRHKVVGGICVVRGQRRWTRLVTTSVRFARLDARARAAYVGSGEGVGKAGGYGIQGRAAAMIESISGSYTNIVGLCVTATMRLIAAAESLESQHD